MKKIKTFIKDNKTELQIVTYGAVMYVAGLYMGKRIEGHRWSESMIALGDTGLKLYKARNNKLYTITVLTESLDK